MSCYAHVIDCVEFLIGNVLVNNDLVNVIEEVQLPCGERPTYGNINVVVLRSLLVNLTCADIVDDVRIEVTCVIQMR